MSAYKWVAHQCSSLSWFPQHEATRSISSPPGWDASPSQGYPQQWIRQYPFEFEDWVSSLEDQETRHSRICKNSKGSRGNHLFPRRKNNSCWHQMYKCFASTIIAWKHPKVSTIQYVGTLKHFFFKQLVLDVLSDMRMRISPNHLTKRGTIRVTCLAQKHNAMPQPGLQDRNIDCLIQISVACLPLGHCVPTIHVHG